jgi:hypothetical protein
MGLGSGIRDPGSEIRKKPFPNRGSRIPDAEVQKSPDPGSGSATLLKGLKNMLHLNAWKAIFHCLGETMIVKQVLIK